MTGTARVKLSHPLRLGDRTIAEVTIRRPKVRDLRAMEKAREPGASEIDQGIAMAAVLCGLPLEALDEMDAADFASISEVLGGFLPRGPA
ncbi:MAG: phage tail assembly protein [Aestuariivirga sp.]|jgi:hypothetical protein|uniref:phage tail assembly protein n=1 Tax=Aestuariivirga sp. TaxID=2650926 RepID=UPI0038CFE9D6